MTLSETDNLTTDQCFLTETTKKVGTTELKYLTENSGYAGKDLLVSNGLLKIFERKRLDEWILWLKIEFYRKRIVMRPKFFIRPKLVVIWQKIII
jgi:hypothetical protein